MLTCADMRETVSLVDAWYHETDWMLGLSLMEMASAPKNRLLT